MKNDKMHFTQTEVETALENLPHGKAKGPDGLRNLLLKRTARFLSVSLKLVFLTQSQTSIGLQPSGKTSNIILHYRDADKQCISNYCLVSPLVCVFKALKSLIFDKLYSAVGIVIRPEQHGFTKQKSTVTQKSTVSQSKSSV